MSWNVVERKKCQGVPSAGSKMEKKKPAGEINYRCVTTFIRQLLCEITVQLLFFKSILNYR